MAAADGTALTGAGTGAGAGESQDPVVESVVLDLAALSPEDVAALPDSVLGALLRRVHHSSAGDTPFVTGHSEGL